MALPSPPGLTPPEIAFLCEMELVTIIPRQRLESLPLLAGPTPRLNPPYRSSLPLWLALLLKRQRRASIVAPPWLHPTSLSAILDREIGPKSSTSTLPDAQVAPHDAPTPLPPFSPSTSLSTPHDAAAAAETLPYHWLEMASTLLAHAADDIPDAEAVRRLLRDLREVRVSKVRAAVGRVDGGAGLEMSGIGAMEVGEGRAFLGSVVDGLRKLGVSRELGRRERAEEVGRRGGGVGDDDDENMEL